MWSGEADQDWSMDRSFVRSSLRFVRLARYHYIIFKVTYILEVVTVEFMAIAIFEARFLLLLEWLAPCCPV